MTQRQEVKDPSLMCMMAEGRDHLSPKLFPRLKKKKDYLGIFGVKWRQYS